MPVLASSPGGLHPRKWVGQIIEEYQRQGIQRGYMFRNPDGTKIKVKTMEPKLHKRLEKVRLKRADLIPVELDISEEY